jgi:hypothetical protein
MKVGDLVSVKSLTAIMTATPEVATAGVLLQPFGSLGLNNKSPLAWYVLLADGTIQTRLTKQLMLVSIS